MTDRFISSIHIQKLGHKIQEIRERALLNIVSKLEHGFVYDNDLARSREILSQLFKWFSFEPCTYQEVVLQLIERIFKSESGRILINHYGVEAISSEIQQIRSCVDPKHYPVIDELLTSVQECNRVTIDVPPLQSDIPLSYRTVYTEPSRTLGSTATPIEGLIQRDSSLEQQTGFWNKAPDTESATKHDIANSQSVCRTEETPYITCNFKWQSLISSDRHVLQSVEESLRNPSEASTLIHSCEFFTDVMLQDFPAEVFLQRPTIILLFYDYLKTSTSTKLSNAILNCLLKLTKYIVTRTFYYRDPNTYNSKPLMSLRMHSGLSSPESLIPTSTHRSYMQNFKSPQSNSASEEDIVVLQAKQLTLPQYCFTTMICVLDFMCVKPENFTENKPRKRLNQTGLNLALTLLDELICLLKLCFKPNAWFVEPTPVVVEVLHHFEKVLLKFGDALEHFRLEVMSSDFNRHDRAIHLWLLYSGTNLLTKLVPLSKADFVLPRILKNVLASTLLDCALARLYPSVHETIFQFVKEFGGHFEADSISKYKEVKSVCNSVTAAIKLLRNSKSLPIPTALELAKEGIPCLELHKNLTYVSIVVTLCANKLPTLKPKEEVFDTAEKLILLLLSHNSMEVREEMYKQCSKRVTAAIGPKLNTSGTGAPGLQIIFLLRAPILVEMCLHGITSDNKHVQKYADDILVHILKCKILVSDEIWNQTIQALIPVLPLLVCYAGKISTLGRTVVGMLDPDSATTLLIPLLEVLKNNLRLLYVDDALTREEAVSRLCWLLTSQENSRNLLPRFNSLQDKALGGICQLQRTIDINKIRPAQRFYEQSALCQVLDLLNSEGVEPVIRRSALTQISVMLEDPFLHYTFLDRNGIKTVIGVMESSLAENDYRNYVDCIIPVISILKNVALHNASTRQELCNNIDIYYYVLRGLLVFCTEERVRQDCSILFCLLLFHEYILGSPVKMDLSLPHLVVDRLVLPFTCNTHWRSSCHTTPSLTAMISDKWCMSTIRVQWNSEWFGGFQEILNWDEVKYSQSDLSQFNELLCLKNNDLLAVKSSSLDYCISKYLMEIQKATSHKSVIDSINKLEGYLNLYIHSKDDLDVVKKDILTFPWEYSFSRFLNAPPANEEDVLLLTTVLKFLNLIVPLYTAADKSCWILSILKNPYHCLPNLLQPDNSLELELKNLHQALLNLITICVWHEQQFFDLYSPKPDESSSETWLHLIEIIADNLKFTDSQHFYNLAYLDSVLACLVHLTTAFGWSRSKAKNPPKEPIPGMILGLCELVGAFHCGKGPSAAESVMGLNITRHVLLILNHLLAEMQCFNVKGWELCFIGERAIEENILYTLCSLWVSRDVVLRAAVFQLLAGLAVSARVSIELVQEIKDSETQRGIWETAILILLDHDEASIVRENAACLLSNLVSHTVDLPADNIITATNLTPVSVRKGNNAVIAILTLLEEFKFYKEVEKILVNLYIGTSYYLSDDTSLEDGDFPCETIRNKGECHFVYMKNIVSDSKSSSTNSDQTTPVAVVTPSLLKSIAVFVNNLLILAETEVTEALQEYGLIKLFFKSLSTPPEDINNVKDLALYCDILEMNTAVCCLLNKAVGNNQICLGTILHTRDCLNVMLSLLNPSLYYINLPQLVYLRNRLWSEVFGMIEALLNSNLSKSCGEKTHVNVLAGEAFKVVSSALSECGHQPFLLTLCEAISSNCSADLQQSALTSLTSLLQLENKTALDDFQVQEESPRSSSIKSLLDNTRTPRTPTIEENINENIENIEPELFQDKYMKVLWERKKQSAMSNKRKVAPNVLENAYFGKVASKLNELNKKRGKINKCGEMSKSDKDVQLDFVESEPLMAGAELCRILLHLYNISNIKSRNSKQNKRKSIIINTLTSILSVSYEAKRLALQSGLMDMISDQLKELHLKLSLESLECLRRIGDKKRVCPILKELGSIIGLITNFMLGEESIKCSASTLGIADLIHKLWIWFCVERSLLSDVLKMLCTYTTDCYLACQSLPLTSAVSGSGPRKIPSNLSLLHEIVALINKEMDHVSRTHDLNILELAFHVLHNSCTTVECRSVLIKTNLFQCISRLHPAITKRQKPWESVEFIWLEFLLTFTVYPEGQAYVAKFTEALDFIMMLTSSTRLNNKKTAILILRNIAFYQPNRPRLLNSDDFLDILRNKLTNGTTEEKNIIVTIMWALVANNQKAKLTLKCAKLDVKLQEALKRMSLSPDEFVNSDSINMFHTVLSILKEGEQGR